MKLSLAIVGMPNVGKSTLFKILTNQDITIANYPFATIDPNVGVVAVPDERLTKLTHLSDSKKTIPAVVEFYDIAGLVKGANQGEGLGNQFLSHIRECQAIVVVLRVFPDPDILHVENSVDPLRDMDIINTELVLKDLETVEKRHKKAEGEAHTGDKKAIEIRDALLTVKRWLEAGEMLFSKSKLESYSNVLENIGIRELQLLTAKKQLYLLNGNESDAAGDVTEKIKALSADYLVMDLKSATDIAPLIRKGYEILDLISFFTTGEDETRAWTIARGMKAPQASGVIHTDFEKKFIRAEVIGTDKLLEVGGWSKAKQKGQLRLEGKEYVMQDGDVIEVRHG